MFSPCVRSAQFDDGEELARLFGQLGYPQAADSLRSRLESVLADPRAGVIVADDAGSLIGAATYFLVPVAHEAGSWCRITALVVDEDNHGRGIGRMLVEAAETAAREAACSRIEATSALHRAGAHGFYSSLGYVKTSAHFLKRI